MNLTKIFKSMSDPTKISKKRANKLARKTNRNLLKNMDNYLSEQIKKYSGMQVICDDV